MTNEQIDLAFGQINRSLTVIENLRTILRNFMDSKKGAVSTGREDYVAFSIVERIYFNLITASGLLKEWAFQTQYAIPVSHILRSVAYEIIFAYWVLDQDFSERMALANHDFIKKNYKQLESIENGSEEQRQQILSTWHAMAPENIEVDSAGIFHIKKLNGRFVFSEVCEQVSAAGHGTEILNIAYSALSQQAHFSDFSRRLISEKVHHQIGIFDTVIRYSIPSCIYLIKKVGGGEPAIVALESLLAHYSN